MPGVKDPNDPTSRIAMQEYLGASRPKILAKSEVEAIKVQYEGAKPKERIALINGLQQKFKGYTRQVLNELELSYDHIFAATQPPRQAEKLIQVLDMKDQDFGLKPEMKNDLAKMAHDAFYADDAMGGVLRKIAEVTGNAEYMSMAKAMENLTTRMTWLQGDEKKGIKETWGDYNFIADEDLAYGWFPKEWDAGEMKQRLREAREKVEIFVSYKKPSFKKPGTKPAINLLTGEQYGAEAGTYQEYLNDLKTKSVWVPSPQEDGFILIDPVTGRAVTKKDGSAIKMQWSGYITR
jgi:hypothetical protein